MCFNSLLTAHFVFVTVLVCAFLFYAQVRPRKFNLFYVYIYMRNNTCIYMYVYAYISISAIIPGDYFMVLPPIVYSGWFGYRCYSITWL